MHIDLHNHTLKPFEYLHILNECEQRLFFFVLGKVFCTMYAIVACY